MSFENPEPGKSSAILHLSYSYLLLDDSTELLQPAEPTPNTSEELPFIHASVEYPFPPAMDNTSPSNSLLLDRRGLPLAIDFDYAPLLDKTESDDDLILLPTSPSSSPSSSSEAPPLPPPRANSERAKASKAPPLPAPRANSERAKAALSDKSHQPEAGLGISEEDLDCLENDFVIVDITGASDDVEERARWLGDGPSELEFKEDYVSIPSKEDFEFSTALPEGYPSPSIKVVLKDCSFIWTMFKGKDWSPLPSTHVIRHIPFRVVPVCPLSGCFEYLNSRGRCRTTRSRPLGHMFSWS